MAPMSDATSAIPSTTDTNQEACPAASLPTSTAMDLSMCDPTPSALLLLLP